MVLSTPIRPISKYACTVWNHAIKWSAGVLPKRALQIINGMSYFDTLSLANMEPLKYHRIKLSKSFFKKICSSYSCLHSLLPPEHNIEVLSKLHNSLNYPAPYSRKKYISLPQTMPWATTKIARYHTSSVF